MSATPGPWRIDDYDTGMVRAGEMLVCQVRGWGHLTVTGKLSEADAIRVQDANARLIAAAPELLEAAKLALADSVQRERAAGTAAVNQLMRAAIAKAEGSVLEIKDAAIIARDRDIKILQTRIDDLTGWIKAANQFAWAHERNCPRHDGDAECVCGLDAFLSRPRPFLESLKARIAELEAELVDCRKVCSGLLAKDLDSSAVARAENAALRKALEDAPHKYNCDALPRWSEIVGIQPGPIVTELPPRGPCNCWKSRISLQ